MMATDTSGMERDQDAMNRLCWNEGRTYNYAEGREPTVPAPFSQDEHRIAVAVEPVPPLHGISIDGEDLLAARKRRREDQQRRLGEMEIGDEARHQLEAMTRADEQALSLIHISEPTR